MQKTKLTLPFTGEWLTFWGGDTLELNHHHDNQSQEYAFDFIQVDEEGRFFKTDGSTNDDYYSFGQAIIAPVTGTIIEAVDGLRDNAPGDVNSYMFIGNYIIIQHADDEFSLLGHLRQGSIMPKVGDTVLRGDKLAECGNSGYSSDPHLHYQVQDSPIFARLENYEKVNVATGIKAYFHDVSVRNANGEQLHKSHSPVKGEFVSNQN